MSKGRLRSQRPSGKPTSTMEALTASEETRAPRAVVRRRNRGMTTQRVMVRVDVDVDVAATGTNSFKVSHSPSKARWTCVTRVTDS